MRLGVVADPVARGASLLGDGAALRVGELVAEHEERGGDIEFAQDFEYALLRELGNPPVPIATTVHPLQLVESFPTETHDAPVALIATPDETIEVKPRRTAPRGIDWKLLPEEALEEMPVLRELKRLSRGS